MCLRPWLILAAFSVSSTAHAAGLTATVNQGVSDACSISRSSATSAIASCAGSYLAGSASATLGGTLGGVFAPYTVRVYAREVAGAGGSSANIDAVASVSDTLSFTIPAGAGSGTIQALFYLMEAGGLAVGADRRVITWYYASYDSRLQVGGYTSNNSAQIRGRDAAGNLGAQSLSANNSRVLSLPVGTAGGTYSFALSYRLAVNVYTTQPWYDAESGKVSTADFGSLAGIAGIEFYDAGGANLTGSVAIGSALGADYHFAAAPVPEPGSSMMLLTGLGLLGLRRRRRKRYAAEEISLRGAVPLPTSARS